MTIESELETARRQDPTQFLRILHRIGDLSRVRVPDDPMVPGIIAFLSPGDEHRVFRNIFYSSKISLAHIGFIEADRRGFLGPEFAFSIKSVGNDRTWENRSLFHAIRGWAYDTFPEKFIEESSWVFDRRPLNFLAESHPRTPSLSDGLTQRVYLLARVHFPTLVNVEMAERLDPVMGVVHIRYRFRDQGRTCSVTITEEMLREYRGSPDSIAEYVVRNALRAYQGEPGIRQREVEEVP